MRPLFTYAEGATAAVSIFAAMIIRGLLTAIKQ